MAKILWMTVDRHPESLRALIRQQLSATGWEIFEVSYDQIDELDAVPLEEIDAVLLAPARFFPHQYMDRLTKCTLMQIWSSGYDKFNIDDAQSRGIPVANNHGSNAVSVAEHTILMMLGVSRRAPEMHNRVITGNWAGNDHGMTSYSLSGKTLGIVGLGNIGTLVGKRAEAFGMHIIFTDPNVAVSPQPRWEKRPFEELLQGADYVTFHVHLEADTHEMLHREIMSEIQRRPFIINASRAELIEKTSLIWALENGIIRGVAMDAQYEEPSSPDDLLFSFPNMFLSPHVAGSTVDSYDETIFACLKNIKSAISNSGILGSL